ncbi:hypothetical protein N8368_02290 [Bacteroidia bacterium]|nr:hypothetical protein [Bacteroidia bacterium]MDB9882529.1 hypothetical protein [Bacteroidia bacterium]MDC1395317.1 hypothetical protein [Bacteroidia bacterium]
MKKSEIQAACMHKLQSQIEELQAAKDKVQESVVGEENSTSGNKFETARAMGQEELDRLNRQMNNFVREMNILSQISPTKPCDTGQLGALIKTDKKTLYLSVALGKVELDKETLYAISTVSPIGQLIMGKGKGDVISFAGKKEKIVSVD